MTNNKCAQGFTLIEVMVALLVVVVSLSALMTKSMSIIDSTAYLHDKTVANWVALNQLELARLTNKHTNQVITTEASGSEEMVGQEWFWRIKPVKGDNEGFMELQISVSKDPDMDSPIITLTGSIDRYHKQ